MKILKTANYKKTAGVDLLLLLVMLVGEDVKELMRTGEPIDNAIDSVIEKYKVKIPQGGEIWDQIKPQIRQWVMGTQNQEPASTPEFSDPAPEQRLGI